MSTPTVAAARHYRVVADTTSGEPGEDPQTSLALLVAEATEFLAYHDPHACVELRRCDADALGSGGRAATLSVVTRIGDSRIVDAGVRLSALACGLLTTTTNDA